MCTFIEDYLKSPSDAIGKAILEQKNRLSDVDDELIYSQIASPEFRLYEEIVSIDYDF